MTASRAARRRPPSLPCPRTGDDLRELLVDVIRRHGGDEDAITEYKTAGEGPGGRTDFDVRGNAMSEPGRPQARPEPRPVERGVIHVSVRQQDCWRRPTY